MRERYVSGYEYYHHQDHRTMTVHETENEPIKTGLLDQHGSPLYRVIERDQVGFRSQQPILSDRRP